MYYHDVVGKDHSGGVPSHSRSVETGVVGRMSHAPRSTTPQRPLAGRGAGGPFTQTGGGGGGGAKSAPHAFSLPTFSHCRFPCIVWPVRYIILRVNYFE